jgi:hypothetical protein
MLVVEGFQKFAGIPFGITRIFESLMPQQIGANRRKNRSIQVIYEHKVDKIPQEVTAMTLQEIIADIHALNEDLEAYERKYGVLSETFYESYTNGEEPEEEDWILDWSDWAGAYKILLRRKEQYHRVIQNLRQQFQTLASVIERTVQHEPISIAS